MRRRSVFGMYRYILALTVIVSHLCGTVILGWLAVHGFFILSGYLMTVILHRDYGYDKAGLSGFLINRILRLFPLYWCILIGTVFLFVMIGADKTGDFYPRMALPDNFGGWAANISLIYPHWFPSRAPQIISTPSWTLTIELLFYALMALGLSRGKGITAIWCLASLLYGMITHIAGLELNWRYATLAAGSLPFALGASLYHCQGFLQRHSNIFESRFLGTWLCVLLIINALFCLVAASEGWTLLLNLTFYSNMILSAGLIANLSFLAKPTDKTFVEKIDRVAGDLSYPTYLMHMPVAFGLSYYVFGTTERSFDENSLILLAMTITLCAIIGMALTRYIDSPIQNIRNRFRRN